MPIPRTWDEELVSEWLQLKGYFVQSGLKVGRHGEADLVGIKNNEVWHIEVGGLSNTVEKDKAMVKRKTRLEIRNSIIKQVGISNPNYKYTYLANYVQTPSIVKNLKNEGYEVKDFPCWYKDIVQDIHDYMYKGRKPKSPRMLPNNLWLLKLISWQLLNKLISCTPIQAPNP